MKQYIALSLLVGACAVALFSIFGDNSYSRMQNLRRSIESQRDKNSILEDRVSELQSKISSLRFDNHDLEHAARNELGMARPNELIFRFDSGLDGEKKTAGVVNNQSVISRRPSIPEDPSKREERMRVLVDAAPNEKKSKSVIEQRNEF